jgi:hypothetical protein
MDTYAPSLAVVSQNKLSHITEMQEDGEHPYLFFGGLAVNPPPVTWVGADFVRPG